MAMMSPTDDPQGRPPIGATAAGEAQSPLLPGDDAPTTELVAATVGDRCATCGTPLASDQNYCVECGERRGKPRFSAMNAGPAPSEASSPRRRRPHTNASVTLVLGIGVLLLAMGVGVEIGNVTAPGTTTAASQRAAAPEIITVGGGGTAAPTSSTASTGKRAKVAKTKTKISAKTAAKAAAAANKVLGSSSNNLAAPTVKQGGKCTHGAGCQGGKFTGTFFGP
jgi:hypothetical protein